jgi:hypothetical protein
VPGGRLLAGSAILSSDDSITRGWTQTEGIPSSVRGLIAEYLIAKGGREGGRKNNGQHHRIQGPFPGQIIDAVASLACLLARPIFLNRLRVLLSVWLVPVAPPHGPPRGPPHGPPRAPRQNYPSKRTKSHCINGGRTITTYLLSWLGANS